MLAASSNKKKMPGARDAKTSAILVSLKIKELSPKFQGLNAVLRALNGELRSKFQGLNVVLRAKYWAIKVHELDGDSHIN